MSEKITVPSPGFAELLEQSLVQYVVRGDPICLIVCPKSRLSEIEKVVKELHQTNSLLKALPPPQVRPYGLSKEEEEKLPPFRLLTNSEVVDSYLLQRYRRVEEAATHLLKASTGLDISFTLSTEERRLLFALEVMAQAQPKVVTAPPGTSLDDMQ